MPKYPVRVVGIPAAHHYRRSRIVAELKVDAADVPAAAAVVTAFFEGLGNTVHQEEHAYDPVQGIEGAVITVIEGDV